MKNLQKCDRSYLMNEMGERSHFFYEQNRNKNYTKERSVKIS
ncbi:hypothetical protein [Fischerella thermalis]|nr:hypothetical protein [Fischerella thermalis]